MAAERERKRIQKALKRKADEEAQKIEADKRPRIERVDIPPTTQAAQVPPLPTSTEMEQDTKMPDPQPQPTAAESSTIGMSTVETTTAPTTTTETSTAETTIETERWEEAHVSPLRSPRRVITFETVEGETVDIELNLGERFHQNGGMGNGIHKEAETTTATTATSTASIPVTAEIVDLEGSLAMPTTHGNSYDNSGYNH